MIKLNLTPQNKQEELILNYLQNNASESLADKINHGTPFEKDGHPLVNKKTLSGFMKYACDEARKLAEKGANSACVDDVTVYGWAIHFFEEDSIEGTLYTIDGEEYKPAPKKVATTKPVSVKPQPSKPQKPIQTTMKPLPKKKNSTLCNRSPKKNNFKRLSALSNNQKVILYIKNIPRIRQNTLLQSLLIA